MRSNSQLPEPVKRVSPRYQAIPHVLRQVHLRDSAINPGLQGHPGPLSGQWMKKTPHGHSGNMM